MGVKKVLGLHYDTFPPIRIDHAQASDDFIVKRAVGDKTLLGYQATSVVGGAVPDWLVARLAMARLESVRMMVALAAHEG